MRRIAALALGTCALLGMLTVPAAATPSAPSARDGGVGFCTSWQILTGTCPYTNG
ncbi:hypothetical protein ABTZ03_33380 [Kitasatospora sp. NPDC096077]|uniref:hypothetical protein n=1 Tax=Kitasatospora sp. NPDC096077 TaxID=3155544 RepID=UPI00331F71C9